MLRQVKSRLLAVALTALLTGLAFAGLARADVRVNVGAIEYDNTLTVVSVLAVSYPVQNPAAWDLDSLVFTHFGDGTVDLAGFPTEEHTFPLLGAKLWVVKVPQDLILNNGGRDTVRAVVDLGAMTAEDTATCGPGVRRTHITGICK